MDFKAEIIKLLDKLDTEKLELIYRLIKRYTRGGWYSAILFFYIIN